MKRDCATNGLFTTNMPVQGPSRSMTEQNINRCSSVTRTISLDDITLEVAIKIAKHGNVHRMRYANAVGLLENKIRILDHIWIMIISVWWITDSDAILSVYTVFYHVILWLSFLHCWSYCKNYWSSYVQVLLPLHFRGKWHFLLSTLHLSSI